MLERVCKMLKVRQIKIEVLSDNENIEILQNDVTPVYWIGSIPDDKLSILVYESLDNIMEQGKVKLLKFSEFPNLRIMIIKIGDNLFAESFEYEEEYF